MCLGATFNLSWAITIHQLPHNLPGSISTTPLPCSKASKDTPGCSEQKLKSSVPVLATVHFSDLMSLLSPSLSLLPSQTSLVFPNTSNWSLSQVFALMTPSTEALSQARPWFTPPSFNFCQSPLQRSLLDSTLSRIVHSSLLCLLCITFFKACIWLVCLLIVRHYH